MYAKQLEMERLRLDNERLRRIIVQNGLLEHEDVEWAKYSVDGSTDTASLTSRDPTSAGLFLHVLRKKENYGLFV